MRKSLAVFAAVALLGGTVGAADALALTKSRAEHAVVKRVKSRFFPVRSAYASCHRLSGSLYGCTYTYFPQNQSLCEGGARVRQFPDGLSVTLGKPHASIDNGGC